MRRLIQTTNQYRGRGRFAYLAVGAVGVAMILPLAACETVEGFGRDVQTGGQALEDTADEAQSPATRR